MDYLACLTCGNAHTDGEFRHLTCRRAQEHATENVTIKELLTTAQGRCSDATKARKEGKKERVKKLLEKVLTSQPLSIVNLLGN